MIANSRRSGWRASFRRPRLVTALWLWNALLGLVVGWGMSRWLGLAFDLSPTADQALQRFQAGLLVELTQYDRFSPWTFATGALWALVVIAALVNALVAAGILEVLISGDERPLLHRFFRGAGHFFGRFLRLLIITGVALLLVWVAVAALTRPIMNALGESSWERTWITVGLFRFALLGALVALLMGILDIARTQVVISATEQRGMLRAWLRAARLTFRRLGTLASIYFVLGVCWLVLAGIGLAIVCALTPTNWAAISLLIVVQQTFMFARGGIRVARAGAVLELVRESDHSPGSYRSYGSSGSPGSYGSSGSPGSSVPEVSQYVTVGERSDTQVPQEPQERQEP